MNDSVLIVSEECNIIICVMSVEGLTVNRSSTKVALDANCG